MQNASKMPMLERPCCLKLILDLLCCLKLILDLLCCLKLILDLLCVNKLMLDLLCVNKLMLDLQDGLHADAGAGETSFTYNSELAQSFHS